MAGNRSLDEFAAGEGGGPEPDEPPASSEPDAQPAPTAPDEEAPEAVDAPAAEEGSTSEAAEAPPLEPKAETFAWSANGGPCARCGEPAEERWRDGDDLVCGGCKAW